MNPTRGKLYQDQLYGAKVLSPLAIAVMDSPEFQRLAALRQLGFSDIMYRGARHSRFEHSVGTYFISRTILRRIVQNHERMGLEHPGQHISTDFRYIAGNSDLEPKVTTYQSRWRGLAEIVSVGALLHDLGHVPFGHTLEDEFAGIFERHDNLAGPRLYEMLFNESSDLAKVFSDDLHERWLEKIPNGDIGRLIYVILSWKENINSPSDFQAILAKALDKSQDEGTRDRLKKLKSWHAEFVERKMFHPFMSDIIGNTICADILDYLPRDRMNLGMEPRHHNRLQRYFTIREGTLYQNEGLRTSIMVTRRGRGGQKRDVATAVLDVMRERYEMAERVFYHHKKAAASAMLAKLVELCPKGLKPRDDDKVYPAPWEGDTTEVIDVPHMAHLSDSGLIDYLGTVKVEEKYKKLQRRLYSAIRFRRSDMYRTLLVIDYDLVDVSNHGIDYFVNDLRGSSDSPSSEGRRRVEAFLEGRANAEEGEVIIYCPSAKMQAKEIDARLEIVENNVLPLRKQERFVYSNDVETLKKYYGDLWRAYVFVSPALFRDAVRCQALVDAFCEHYDIHDKAVAYRKVRTHILPVGNGDSAEGILRSIEGFVSGLPFSNMPTAVTSKLFGNASQDDTLAAQFKTGADARERMRTLLDVSILQSAAEDNSTKKLNNKQKKAVDLYCSDLLAGSKSSRISTEMGDWTTFESYADYVLASALPPSKAEAE